MKRAFLLAIATSAAATAMGVTRSSFYDAEVSGVLWTISPDGLTYTIQLDVGAIMTYQGVTYDVIDLSGAFALDNDDDMTAAAPDQNGWAYLENYSGTGGIAGWDTNPNLGLNNGDPPLTFVFSTMQGQAETIGFHLRFAQTFLPTGDNTAYVSPVPEPMGILGIGVGLLGLLRRRAAKKG